MPSVAPSSGAMPRCRVSTAWLRNPSPVGVSEPGDLLGWALGDELAAVFARFRAEVENPIGGFDDIEVVFNDEQRVAGIDELPEDG